MTTEMEFRRQSLERTEDRLACGASRRSEDRKPSARVQRTGFREDRRQVSLRRFAPGEDENRTLGFSVF
ncbi:MAG: hypothetical protein LBD06_11080 [Candidatus Accumulibacter sp.]|nr:hypothetical protein [Accumulibacter sp.]